MIENRVRVGFIGSGNIATSLIKGIKALNKDASIIINDVFMEKAEEVALKYDCMAGTKEEVFTSADIVVIAVKPNNIAELLDEIASSNYLDRFKNGAVLASVAAGIGIEFYERKLPDVAFVRAMPNTSAAVQKAITGLVKGKYLDEDKMLRVEKVFSAIGDVIWITDDKINALTAVSGSGPAYFYYLAECMIKAGIRLGLSKEESSVLACQTLVGAGRMIENDPEPSILRARITSPNGTTHAAITTMQEMNFEELIYTAMENCANRGNEMEEVYTGGK